MVARSGLRGAAGSGMERRSRRFEGPRDWKKSVSAWKEEGIADLPQLNPRAAPELGCSHTELCVYMECLEGVYYESVANHTNQKSWLVGEKSLTLICWLEEVEGLWDAKSLTLTPGQRTRQRC
ncbi:uncharacterized protein RHO17_023550 isoform 1-T1 [Thomomys bottae]